MLHPDDLSAGSSAEPPPDDVEPADPLVSVLVPPVETGVVPPPPEAPDEFPGLVPVVGPVDVEAPEPLPPLDVETGAPLLLPEPPAVLPLLPAVLPLLPAVLPLLPAVLPLLPAVPPLLPAVPPLELPPDPPAPAGPASAPVWPPDPLAIIPASSKPPGVRTPPSAPVIALKTAWAITIAPMGLECSPSESLSGGLM